MFGSFVECEFMNIVLFLLLSVGYVTVAVGAALFSAGAGPADRF